MQSADYLRGIDQRQQAFEMGLSTEALVEAFGGSIEPVRAQLERISVSAEQARVGEKMVDKREILELARQLRESYQLLGEAIATLGGTASALGVPNREVASACGVSTSTVGRWSAR